MKVFVATGEDKCVDFDEETDVSPYIFFGWSGKVVKAVKCLIGISAPRVSTQGYQYVVVIDKAGYVRIYFGRRLSQDPGLVSVEQLGMLVGYIQVTGMNEKLFEKEIKLSLESEIKIFWKNNLTMAFKELEIRL